jgi:6-pyruvoyltetrahydropterin/6-carboxytetrahydropterin synthase
MTRTTLHLYKQNFKFSSAHFLIFDEQKAEKLHGHNYQVRVDLEVAENLDLKAKGFFVDFNVFKKAIKARLDLWDEMVLLPAKHPDMKVTKKSPSLEVRFRDRFYVFPENEVHLLPVTNTSVEQLSRLLAEVFFSEFKSKGVSSVRVRVEETRGQAASHLISD